MANALLTSWTSSGTFKTMDERLERLVTEAQRHAPQTEGRQLALNQLVDEILQCDHTKLVIHLSVNLQ